MSAEELEGLRFIKDLNDSGEADILGTKLSLVLLYMEAFQEKDSTPYKVIKEARKIVVKDITDEETYELEKKVSFAKLMKKTCSVNQSTKLQDRVRQFSKLQQRVVLSIIREPSFLTIPDAAKNDSYQHALAANVSPSSTLAPAGASISRLTIEKKRKISSSPTAVLECLFQKFNWNGDDEVYEKVVQYNKGCIAEKSKNYSILINKESWSSCISCRIDYEYTTLDDLPNCSQCHGKTVERSQDLGFVGEQPDLQILFYNCQGINSSSYRLDEINEMLKEPHLNPQFMFLSETKLSSKTDMNATCQVLGFEGYIMVNSAGGGQNTAGGLSLFWKKGFKPRYRSSCKYWIDVDVLNGPQPFRLTGFYGHPGPSSKEREEVFKLLQLLSDLDSYKSSKPWVVCGDMNEILTKYEKWGSDIEQNHKRMQIFKETINHCNLNDLGFVGEQPFTFARPGSKGRLKERLDRALGSHDWISTFKKFRVVHTKFKQDHIPLILEVFDSGISALSYSHDPEDGAWPPEYPLCQLFDSCDQYCIFCKCPQQAQNSSRQMDSILSQPHQTSAPTATSSQPYAIGSTSPLPSPSTQTAVGSEALDSPLLVRSLMNLADRIMNPNTTATVPIKEEVLAVHTQYLLKENIIAFCRMGAISGVCMSIYIRHLYSAWMRSQGSTLYKYVFVDPSLIYSGNNEKTLSHRLSTDNIVLVPYYNGSNWVLVVIDGRFKSKTVYYFDPMGGSCNKEIEDFVNNAMKMNQKNFQWKHLQCPKPGGVESGHYVMRFMKDIAGGKLSILSRLKYTQEHINEVMEEWAQNVHILLEGVGSRHTYAELKANLGKIGACIVNPETKKEET